MARPSQATMRSPPAPSVPPPHGDNVPSPVPRVVPVQEPQGAGRTLPCKLRFKGAHAIAAAEEPRRNTSRSPTLGHLASLEVSPGSVSPPNSSSSSTSPSFPPFSPCASFNPSFPFSVHYPSNVAASPASLSTENQVLRSELASLSAEISCLRRIVAAGMRPE